MFRTLIATLLVGSCLVLHGCGSKREEDRLADAKESIEKGDLKAAAVQLKSALEERPNSPEARYLLGRALLESGDGIAAEVELRKAEELGFSGQQIRPALAQAMLLSGKFKEVIEQYGGQQLSSPALDAQLKTVVATAYLVLGDRERASTVVASALSQAQEYAPALLLQARIIAAAGDHDRAMIILKQVIARVPKNYEAQYLKGLLLQEGFHDLPAAREAYMAAVAAKADYLPAYQRLISNDLKQNDLEAAKSQLAALKKVLPTHPETLYYEVQLAYLRKDLLVARELAQQLLRRAPDSVPALQVAGATELQLQSYVQAERLLGKALAKAPEDMVIRRLLAQTYLRAGQTQKAVELLDASLLRSGNDIGLLSVAAEAALQSGDANRAEELFSRVARLDPKSTLSRTALVMLQMWKSGDQTLALNQLTSLASTETDTYADMALISTYMRRGDFQAALKATESLERKMNDKVLIAMLRGQIHIRLHDVKSARVDYQQALSANAAYYPAAAALATLDRDAGNREAAIGRFRSVLKVDPNNVRARMALAAILGETDGASEESLSLLGEAVKLDPANSTPRRQLFEYYFTRRNFKQAIVVAQEGLAAMPDNPVMLEALGLAQTVSGNFQQAASAFQKLVAIAPKQPYPHLRLAEMYKASGNQTAAFQSLKRALELQPDFVPARHALLELVASKRFVEEALALSKDIQRRQPQLPAAYRLEGDIEGTRRAWSKAADAYRRGLKVSADSTELAMNLHLAMRMESNGSGEAEKFASVWMKSHPRDARFAQNLGELALRSGDWPAAESNFAMVVGVQPENLTALNNLAWAMAMQNKSGALTYAERAVLLAPDFPSAADTLAVSLAAAGQPAAAIERLRAFLARHPESSGLRLRLAKLLIESGKPGEARPELEALVKLGNRFSAHEEAGKLLAKL